MSEEHPIEDKQARLLKNKLYQPLSEITVGHLRYDTNKSIEDVLTSTLPPSEAGDVQNLLSSHICIKPIKERKVERAKVVRKKGLSKKEERILGLHTFPRNAIKYKNAKKMNKLWTSYIKTQINLDILSSKGKWYNPEGHVWQSISTLLLKVDYHGAYVTVNSSKCPSLVGLSGIIILDTKYTFKIVSPDNITRTIPKEPCIFQLKLENYVFKIFGKSFCSRSSERCTKKFKTLLIPEL